MIILEKLDIFFKAKKQSIWKIERIQGLSGVRNKKRIIMQRIDHGRKYMSKEFKNHCSTIKIQKQHTMAHTPKQNGVAKHQNQTLID